MSNETPKIDKGLAKEFDELVKEEGGKITPEEQLRKSIWALEVLKQEKKVNPETTFEELIRIIDERIIELKQTIVYAEDTANSGAGDETDTELHDVAQKEVETSKRLLDYMQAAWFSLKPMSMDQYNSYRNFKDIEDMLKREQVAKEFIVDQDEKMHRRENK